VQVLLPELWETPERNEPTVRQSRTLAEHASPPVQVAAPQRKRAAPFFVTG
jgi:hypothetical protein